MKYIKGAKIITESGVLENYILGFDNNFCEITPENEFDIANGEIIDGKNLYVAPGLIDLHIHGSGSKDTMDATDEAITSISSTIIKNGVTSFLPTTMTMSKEKIKNALSQVRKSMQAELPGAQVLGAHMEGPFINTQFKGAQNDEFILEPVWEIIEPFIDVIKLVTIAPEITGAIEVIKKLKQNNIVASMGHSAATFEQAQESVEAGITHCTHLFNAMSGVHHRNPGVATASLANKKVNCEVIADKIHLHAGLFQLIKNAKGVNNITLVTDCIEAGGMGEGAYSLGGQPVTVKNGSARLADGTLAGSVLTLNKAVFNFYKNTDAKIHEAFAMASLNPAKELGIDNKKGSVSIGKDADFSLMDENFEVKQAYIKGKCVYNNK